MPLPLPRSGVTTQARLSRCELAGHFPEARHGTPPGQYSVGVLEGSHLIVDCGLASPR
eukprot:COSAG05_NODE_22766_length_262_cov_0.957055_1_plen_57_part_10